MYIRQSILALNAFLKKVLDTNSCHNTCQYLTYYRLLEKDKLCRSLPSPVQVLIMIYIPMITYWYSSNIQYTILHENKKKKILGIHIIIIISTNHHNLKLMVIAYFCIFSYKINYRLRRKLNHILQILRKINSMLLGENVQLEDLYQDPTILSCFKYAPITSVDVKLFNFIAKAIPNTQHIPLRFGRQKG
ncbi:piwi-like protein Siwi [Aphis craccivora]|uniref:Piwi-like protein Siwi n=1 Tax=Aphis craccivora TaxID=307492 RepID=A0A6G0YEI3_APHCR|nr:piwi-like protein Siwi [Aphis craccivora]